MRGRGLVKQGKMANEVPKQWKENEYLRGLAKNPTTRL
jgi:hypothetical protein